jgi:excisionase family DNA binding protein
MDARNIEPSMNRMTVKEAAMYLEATQQRIYRLIARRKLSAQKNELGGYEIDKGDLEEIAFGLDVPSCPLMCPLSK